MSYLGIPVYYRSPAGKLRQFNVPCSPEDSIEDAVEHARSQVLAELVFKKEPYKKPILALIQGGKA